MTVIVTGGIPGAVDVIVVGGGMSGLAVAAALSVEDLDVLVVEAGPDAGRLHYRREFDEATANRLWLDPASDPYFWRSYQPMDGSFSGIAGQRRRLGGRSLYWHGLVLPIDGWALDDSWPVTVVQDLTGSWQGGDPLLGRTAQRLAAWSDSPASGDPVSLAGHTFTTAPLAVRAAPGQAGWEAYSPLSETAAAPAVSTGCFVREVLLQDGAACGVRLDREGGTHDVAAGAVVLAASTVENSRLAIQALHGLGVLPVPRLPGLVDKIAHGFVGSFRLEELPAHLQAAARQGRFLASPGPASLRSNLYLRAGVNPFGVALVEVYLLGEQHRAAENAVWCTPAEAAPWPTFVQCSPTEADRPVIQGQRGDLQRIWQELLRLSGRRAGPLTFEPGVGSVDLPSILTRGVGLRAPVEPYTYSFPLGSEQHEAGTLALGELLSDQHEFTDIRGLFAAGPGTFPRTGAANPVLTTLALATRLAHHVWQRHAQVAAAS